MIARVLQSTNRPVNTGVLQPQRQRRAQKEVVEAKPCVALPALTHVVPEGVDAIIRMHLAKSVRPPLIDQSGKRSPALGVNQSVVVP